MPTIHHRFLAKLLFGCLIFTAALVGAHTIQAERIPAALKRQADRADAAGKPDAAARYLRRYLEFKPDDTAVRVSLAENIRSRAGSLIELFHLYEKILRAEPGRVDQRRQAVEVCLRLRRFTDASEHAEKYLEQNPADTAVRLHLATAHAALGRVADAVSAYEATLKYAPSDAAIFRRYIAYLTTEANRPGEAKSVIDRMVAALPDSPESYLARARFELSKPDAVPGAGVLADANKALALAPLHAEALILKAECLQRSRDVAGARDCLTTGLKEHPGDVRFVKRLAWLELNRGNPGRAVLLLDEGLKAAREGFEELLVPLGDLLVHLGETGRADEIVRTLESRKGPIPALQAKYLKARLLVHGGKWPEAVSLLSVVRTEGQSFSGLEGQANLLLALSYRQLGDTDRERECLKLILDRDPRHSAARVALAQSFLNAGQFGEALREYETAARSPYSSGSTAAMVLRLLGVKARSGGRPDEWVALDRAALSLAAKVGPASSDVAELRADLSAWQGRPDRAVAILRQEVARRPGNAALWAKLVDATGTLFGTAAGYQVLDEAFAMAGDGPDLRLARAMLSAKDPARLRPIEWPDLQLDSWPESDRTQYLFGLVEIYDRLGDDKGLIRVYGQVTRQRSNDPAAWYAAYRAGHPDAAGRIREIEGPDGPTVALVRASEAAKTGADLEPTLAAVTAVYGSVPHNVEACLVTAQLKRAMREPESAAALLERAVKLDPTGMVANREYLRFLAETGAGTKLASFLGKLNGDPRWVGDPIRRLVSTACHRLSSDSARVLVSAAGTAVTPDVTTAAWMGEISSSAGMKNEARTYYERAVASPFAGVDDWIRLALFDPTGETIGPVSERAKGKLSGMSYWAFRATLLACGKINPPTNDIPPESVLPYTQARLALELTRNDRQRAMKLLEEAISDSKLRPEESAWVKRTLGMVLADRGTPGERKRAYDLLVADPTTVGTTPDEKRTTAAVLASLARYADGPERITALTRAAELLAEVSSITNSPRDKFLRFQVLRSIGGVTERNEARKLLNELIDPKAPNLEYLIAGLTEVGELETETERTLAGTFSDQLRKSFPDEFRAVAEVARHACRVGKFEEAVALVDGYVRAETGPADAQTRTARAADLLDSLARYPSLGSGSEGPVIVPVGGVARTGSDPRRRLVDSAVAKYEGLIAVRPEAAAAAASLLAFDGRPAEALSLVEMHPSLATRLKAAAGVAVLRAGPVSSSQTVKVKSWLDSAKAEEPDSIAVMLTEGEYLAHLQDYSAAEKVYDAVLSVDPQNVVALNNLAWMLAPNPAHSVKALDLLDRAAGRAGLTPELLDTRARIRIAARQAEQAERDALQALASEKTPLRYFHLAMARQAMSPPRGEEARAAFRLAKARGLAPSMVHPADLPVLRSFEAGN